MKKKVYNIYGLTEDEIKAVARDVKEGTLTNVSFVMDMFGNISYLRTRLTPFEAVKVRRQMRKDNFKDRTNHYELILAEEQ